MESLFAEAVLVPEPETIVETQNNRQQENQKSGAVKEQVQIIKKQGGKWSTSGYEEDITTWRDDIERLQAAGQIFLEKKKFLEDCISGLKNIEKVSKFFPQHVFDLRWYAEICFESSLFKSLDVLKQGNNMRDLRKAIEENNIAAAIGILFVPEKYTNYVPYFSLVFVRNLMDRTPLCNNYQEVLSWQQKLKEIKEQYKITCRTEKDIELLKNLEDVLSRQLSRLAPSAPPLVQSQLDVQQQVVESVLSSEGAGNNDDIDDEEFYDIETIPSEQDIKYAQLLVGAWRNRNSTRVEVFEQLGTEAGHNIAQEVQNKIN